MSDIQRKLDNYELAEKKRKLQFQISQAKEELRKKDYIGNKISEAILYNDEMELIKLRSEYRSEIEQRKLLRQKINEWEAELEALTLQ